MSRCTGEYVYWATEEIPPNTILVVDTLQYLQRRPELPNEQNALMATSYAMLLYLFQNEFENARPIMKWIHTQHMGVMKYSSTIVSHLFHMLATISTASYVCYCKPCVTNV